MIYHSQEQRNSTNLIKQKSHSAYDIMAFCGGNERAIELLINLTSAIQNIMNTSKKQYDRY